MAGIERFRPWFYAAAAYNLVWGIWVMAFPDAVFDLIGVTPPQPIAIWQCVGMMVFAYAPAYWLIARNPVRYGPLVWIGILGKTLGPLGFLISAAQGRLPWVFGWTIVFNDLIWHPAFWAFGLKYARSHQTSIENAP